MEQKKKIIFFDFDGVIADSFDVAFEINKIIDHKIIVKKDFQDLFDGNINDWTKDTSYGEEEIKKINDDFFAKYIPQMKKVKIFPGMKEVIAELAKTYILLIISSTIISPIRDFLNRNNIFSYFDNIVGSNFVDANKAERIKMVLEKYGVDIKDCVFITDTLGDMREAASLGIQSIGVTWGFQEKENLLKGNPFHIAEKAEDLNSIISECFKKLDQK